MGSEEHSPQGSFTYIGYMQIRGFGFARKLHFEFNLLKPTGYVMHKQA